MTDNTPYTVPQEPGRLRAIALAVIVHVALIVFFWIGVRWQNEVPVAVEAEIWSPQTMEAAPRPQAPPQPEPVPVPVAKPEPRPEPKPEPKPEPVVTPRTPPVAKPDIALEQEKKKKKLEEEKRLAEERAEEKREEKREEEKKLARAKQEREAAERKKDELQAKALEKKLAEQKAADEKHKQEQAKAAAEAKRKQAEAADAKAADARRMADMNRLQAQAGTAVGTGGTGTAAKSQGSRADANYISKVGAKIKSNTAFNVPEELAGNPAVEFQVELLPDGSVRSVRKVKSSGVPGFDDAVARAIDKSQPYPADRGVVPSGFTVSHKPKDQ